MGKQKLVLEFCRVKRNRLNDKWTFSLLVCCLVAACSPQMNQQDLGTKHMSENKNGKTTRESLPEYSFSQAVELSQEVLGKESSVHKYEIQPELTQTHEFGWVFFYAPRKYIETKDPKYLTPGDGPLVFERIGGKTQFLASSVPPAVAIDIFKKDWLAKQKK
jgi:hypothetical protein